MSISLIREERITQNGNGLQIEHDFYIKLDAAFDELLPELARSGLLPSLLHIQLREAYASSGQGDPATLKTIAHASSCEERQARRIVKALLGRTLIAEAGLSPKTGEKFYRALGYAWFGNKHSKPRVSRMTPHLSHDTPLSLVVVDDLLNKQASEEEQQTTENTKRVFAILRACGVFGRAQIVLSESITEQCACEWQTWIRSHPKGITNAQGVMISALLADPLAQPPQRLIPDEKAHKSTITGKLAHLTNKENADEGDE